ncbi:MAG: ATPase, T2SS/T4P/T4SS family, partial [Actinomycetota bacterium]
MIAADEIVGLVDHIRRDFGATLPAAPVRESHRDRDRRQEETTWILEHEILPKINEQRVSERERRLTEDDEDRIVDAVLSSMFLLPHLLAILDSEPLAEDVVVLGASEVRVDRADGSIGLYPAMVRTDTELQDRIADIAVAHHRPFSFESPWVDVQLSRRLRFHGQGFDIVSRPGIFIRVHRALGATFDDLYRWGSMTAGLAYFLRDVVPKAQFSVVFTGVQGSGKTTALRSQCLAYDADTRFATVETDYELGLAELGLPWTQEMQARIPVTSNSAGITCGDMMPAVLRMRAAVNTLGEVRGNEAGPAVRAANVGQGTLVTVHGHSAVAGLEQLVDRMVESDQMDRSLARRTVYQSFDLVVHCAMAPNRHRWIQEVIAPTVEGDQPKFHTLYAPDPTTGDLRAQATRSAWPAMLT